MPDAIPANSLKVVEVLPINKTSIAKAVHLIPNLSRIKAEKPLPVTTPILAAVPCAIIKSIHIIGIVQSVENPKFAPAIEYVAIPPASLPAIAVMIPGPIAHKINQIFDDENLFFLFGELKFLLVCSCCMFVSVKVIVLEGGRGKNGKNSIFAPSPINLQPLNQCDYNNSVQRQDY